MIRFSAKNTLSRKYLVFFQSQSAETGENEREKEGEGKRQRGKRREAEKERGKGMNKDKVREGGTREGRREGLRQRSTIV